MISYADIHIEDLKNLSLKSFTEILLNDLYPFLFSEMNKLDDCMTSLSFDYDVDILQLTHKKILLEFDEMYRKEKLVLFPFLIKLDENNEKSSNCTPFKNIKVHYTSMMHAIDRALDIAANFFVSNLNQSCVRSLQIILLDFKNTITEIQTIKDTNFYKNYKGCGSCNTIHE